MRPIIAISIIFAVTSISCGPVEETSTTSTEVPSWEADNPVLALPTPPLGTQVDWEQVPWVTPEKVRLGRWLYWDTRLSADDSVACATCHKPEAGFSETTPVSTGISGQKGGRKAPTFLNGAFPLYPNYFWDGRAGSLQEQAGGPMENPIEMGSNHDLVVTTVSGLEGYRAAFRETYGDDVLDIGRITETIAAYEATRLSGNSKYDRYEAGDKTALSEIEANGRELFFKKADCSQCHISWNFADSLFYNLGVGWDGKKAKAAGDDKAGFADVGRYAISDDEKDIGAFKTPTLRDISKHPPYMHDGSIPTLREVVEHYNMGGNDNPWLHERVKELDLSEEEIDAVVAFMNALDGEGYMDTAPKSFPQ